MAVTIKEIAQACGVSRGTVDRVLNNRGKVKPETEQLIQETAKTLGYRPNGVGKALAARKKNYVIGIILISEGNDFFKDVLNGIQKAEYEIADYGLRLLIQTMKGYQVERQIALMQQMKENVQCLILNGINDERIAQEIREYQRRGIPVMTLNSDVEKSDRLHYTGCDFQQNGRTAAGMLGLITAGTAQVGIATGSVKSLGHNQRIYGFHTLCRQKYPGISIADVVETNDDDVFAFQQTKHMLQEHPDITAVYVVAAGTEGVCRAIWESEKRDNIVVIASDSTSAARRWMKKGLIRAVICQQPWQQGYRSVMTAMNYLVKNIKPKKDDILPNEIYISENLEK